jgi:hypothetical protein
MMRSMKLVEVGVDTVLLVDDDGEAIDLATGALARPVPDHTDSNGNTFVNCWFVDEQDRPT